MAGIIEVTRRLTVRSGDAVLLDYGSIIVPEQPTGTACAGVPILRPRTITLAPGASATLWSYSTDGEFVEFWAECDGVCWIEQMVDAPVSGSDHTAAGTAVNHPKDTLSCVSPKTYSGMAVPVVASAANYAASAFHATTAWGRRYSITVKNPSDAEDSVNVTYMWTL